MTPSVRLPTTRTIGARWPRGSTNQDDQPTGPIVRGRPNSSTRPTPIHEIPKPIQVTPWRDEPRRDDEQDRGQHEQPGDRPVAGPGEGETDEDGPEAGHRRGHRDRRTVAEPGERGRKRDHPGDLAHDRQDEPGPPHASSENASAAVLAEPGPGDGDGQADDREEGRGQALEQVARPVRWRGQGRDGGGRKDPQPTADDGGQPGTSDGSAGWR